MAELTGNRRHRKTIFGKMVLQVEERRYYTRDLNGSGYYDEWDANVWRDAKWHEVYVENNSCN